MTTLFFEFKKIENDDKTLYRTFYLNSKSETVVNENDIDDVFELIYSTIVSNIQTSLGKDHNINILKYNTLAGSSYIKLPKELNHPKKGLINIQILRIRNASNGT